MLRLISKPLLDEVNKIHIQNYTRQSKKSDKNIDSSKPKVTLRNLESGNQSSTKDSSIKSSYQMPKKASKPDSKGKNLNWRQKKLLRSSNKLNHAPSPVKSRYDIEHALRSCTNKKGYINVVVWNNQYEKLVNDLVKQISWPMGIDQLKKFLKRFHCAIMKNKKLDLQDEAALKMSAQILKNISIAGLPSATMLNLIRLLSDRLPVAHVLHR